MKRLIILLIFVSCGDGHHLDQTTSKSLLPVICTQTGSQLTRLMASTENVIVDTPIIGVGTMTYDLSIDNEAPSYSWTLLPDSPNPSQLITAGANDKKASFHFDGLSENFGFIATEMNFCDKKMKAQAMYFDDLQGINLSVYEYGLAIPSMVTSYASGTLTLKREIFTPIHKLNGPGNIANEFTEMCVEFESHPTLNTCVTMPIDEIAVPITEKIYGRILYKGGPLMIYNDFFFIP